MCPAFIAGHILDSNGKKMKTSDILIEKMKVGGKCIIGMVHCLPFPGTYDYGYDIEAIYSRAREDTEALHQIGVDAIIVENTNDKPSAAVLEPEQIATLAAVTRIVVENADIPVGVDAAFNDGSAAIAIAVAANAAFIRSPVFVDNMLATGIGSLTPCAKKVIRLRRLLGAESIGIWADIQVKHAHTLLKEVSLEESVAEACQCGAEAVIATGASTGIETPLEKLKVIKKAAGVPVIIGSGFNIDNAIQQLAVADGAIVGTAIKENGTTMSRIDLTKGNQLMEKVNRIIINA